MSAPQTTHTPKKNILIMIACILGILASSVLIMLQIVFNALLPQADNAVIIRGMIAAVEIACMILCTSRLIVTANDGQGVTMLIKQRYYPYGT